MHKGATNNNMLQIFTDPQTVYISTDPNQSSYTSISVKVKNNDSSPAVLNSIAITLPEALAPAISLGSIIPVADPANLFDFGPSAMNAGEFDATPSLGASVTLDPGDSWVFTLQTVTLPGPGTQPQATFTVAVVFGDGSVYSESPVIKMEPAIAAITLFNAKPSDINPGESTTLNWKCTEIDYCIISPGDGTHLPASDQLEVSPPSTTNYTLYAYGDGVMLSAQWGISVEYAQIMEFAGKDGQPSVDYGENITLVWECNQFTQSIGISDDKDVAIPDYSSGTNTPQQGNITVGPITEPTTFTLDAYGNNQQNFDQRTPIININDVSCTLTANPADGTWQKDKVTVAWTIKSASSVSISPELSDGPSLQNLVGSVDIYPEQDVTYVITATGFIGNVPGTTSCSLTLTVTPVQITDFTISPTQIVAAAGGVNAATLNWSAQAQTLSLDNGIGDVIGTTSYALTAPADQTAYILSAGTFQNPGLCAQQVTVQNGWGPFQGTIVPMDALNIPIPASPYQAYIQAEMDYISLFPLPVAYANLLPLTYYILEIDGVTGDSGVDYINSVDPVLGAQLTTGRYLGYFDVYQNTIYGDQITVPFFGIIVKFDTVADYPVTIKIITITPALS